jgi:hypothetical protein
MLAQHPLTGKPIRVVKCSAQLWRDAKTLVLLKEDSDTGIAWDRWETCAAGLQTVQSLRKKGVPIHIPIFLDEPDFTFEDLERESKMSHLVVVSMKVIQEIGSDAFKEGKLRNIVCLDEFIHLYSYCGEVWNGTLEDAVVLLCMILKYSRVAGISSEGLDTRARKDRIEAMKIKMLGLDAKPPALWLIQQYYRPDKVKRAREVKRCLEENIRCSYVDKILLLNEADYSADFPKGNSDKIIQKVVGKRLTYEMVIREIFESVPEGVIAVFSNSDIFLENTTRILWSLSMEDRFLSLLRWDVPEEAGESKMFGPRDDSQDTWIVSSDSVKQRKWKWDDLAFPFGKNGCDNAINVEMLRQKFLISNPAYSIKTQHVHSSGYRTYNPQDIVDKPIYLHIAPTGLNDMNAKEKFDTTTILKKATHKTFDRAIQSVQEKEIKTFCNMLRRNEVYDYVYGSKNNFTQDSDTILGLKDSFCTPNGLPYGHHELYVGNTARSKELWSSTGIAGCQPTVETNLGIIAPLTEKELGSQEDFCLKYLAKIMQIRTLGGEFLCPKENSLIDVLRLFRWDSTTVPVIEQTPNSSVYYKNGVIWTPSDTDSRTKEDIDALRSHLFVPWLGQLPKSKKITIIEDGELLDTNWVAALEDIIGDSYDIHVIWPGRTSLERILTVLRDTEILIYANSETTLKTWSWMWLLPEGAHCIELQNEMDPRGDSIHLAGASQLDLWLIIMRKGIKEHMRRDTVGLVCKTLQNGIFSSEVKKSDLPIVWLPRGDIQGFYGHTGDSFREMVRMWGERGLCQVKEHPVATLCWWGDVGTGCLLYDRPNLDWFYNAPPLEQTWKKALFGNPEPLSGGKTWSFWPRRPRLVEEIVAKGLPTHGFSERSRSLVFYGKVENRVQEKRRTTADWIEICDEFIMPKGDDSKYPFTQEEYLIKLTEAKYGLCLAGYGRKCHREVECMAMGCVPVVEKEVDISNYANPPVEGVHYLRITEPSLLGAQLAAITEENWTKMSLACRTWWRENVSCDGMFALTKKLVDVA